MSADTPPHEPAHEVPMTAEQTRCLTKLCEQAGEPFDPELTSDQADRMIADLRKRTGADDEMAGGSPGQSAQTQ